MENLHVVSHFNTKHSISALYYAQDFGTTVKESLKRTTNSRWTSFSKSRVAPCLKILSCLCQHSQLYVSPICANSDKWREVVMSYWIENFQPVWQQTIEAIQLKIKRVYTTASRDYVMLFAIFLKNYNVFSHQVNSKKTGPVLLFKTIFWHWYCFPTNKIRDIEQPDKYETDSDHASDEEVVYGRTCMTG